MIISPDPPRSRRPTFSWRSLRAALRRSIRKGRAAEFLASLPAPVQALLSEGWLGRAGEHQLPPDEAGSWHTWLVLGGRGAGKTRAGAE